MSQPLAVLLLDDGELDDVQRMLEEMKVAWGRLRGSSIVPGKQPASTVVVTTPRHLKLSVTRDRRETPIRVVVTSEDSPTMRKQLRAIGIDYLVRRPVHPEALRLLILHCLYTGDERRSEPRIPLGVPTTFSAGLIRRSATLADLSTRGCRLFSNTALKPGKRFRLKIPESLGTARALSVRGRVLRMHFDPRLGDGGMYCAAVAFEELPAKTRQEIEWILEEMASGPPPLSRSAEVESEQASRPEREMGPWPRELSRVKHDPRAESPSPREAPAPEAPPEPESARSDPAPGPSAPASQQPAEGASASERRKRPRRVFGVKVPAFGSRALRVLVGRDLSTGGMRVDASPDLELGDRLHLAIYADPDAEPFLVWATVSRDDGADGFALVFDAVHPAVAEQLERLVLSLPAVENLHDGETAAMGTVVTEILES